MLFGRNSQGLEAWAPQAIPPISEFWGLNGGLMVPALSQLAESPPWVSASYRRSATLLGSTQPRSPAAHLTRTEG